MYLLVASSTLDEELESFVVGDLPTITPEIAGNGACAWEWIPLVGIPNVLRKVDAKPNDPWRRIIYESVLTSTHLAYYTLPLIYAVLQRDSFPK